MKKYGLIPFLILFIVSLFCFISITILQIKQSKQQKDKIIELTDKVNFLEQSSITIADQYNELEVQYDKIEQENITLQELINSLTQENERLQDNLDNKIQEIEQKNQKIEQLENDLADAQAKKKEREQAAAAVSGNFQGVELQYSAPYNITENKLTATKGVVYYNGHKECYYTQTLLPGDGLYLPGRHVAEDGTIRDGDGYICVAADLSFLPRYSTVMTTLGPGKVYDTGCAYGTVDIYTDW